MSPPRLLTDRLGHPLLIGARVVVLRSDLRGTVGHIMRVKAFAPGVRESVRLVSRSGQPIDVRPTWVTVIEDPKAGGQRRPSARQLTSQRVQEAILQILAEHPPLTVRELTNTLRTTTGRSISTDLMRHHLRELAHRQEVYVTNAATLTPNSPQRRWTKHPTAPAAPTPTTPTTTHPTTTQESAA